MSGVDLARLMTPMSATVRHSRTASQPSVWPVKVCHSHAFDYHALNPEWHSVNLSVQVTSVIVFPVGLGLSSGC